MGLQVETSRLEGSWSRRGASSTPLGTLRTAFCSSQVPAPGRCARRPLTFLKAALFSRRGPGGCAEDFAGVAVPPGPPCRASGHFLRSQRVRVQDDGHIPLTASASARDVDLLSQVGNPVGPRWSLGTTQPPPNTPPSG